jgi:hypothetical protein
VNVPTLKLFNVCGVKDRFLLRDAVQLESVLDQAGLQENQAGIPALKTKKKEFANKEFTKLNFYKNLKLADALAEFDCISKHGGTDHPPLSSAVL